MNVIPHRSSVRRRSFLMARAMLIVVSALRRSGAARRWVMRRMALLIGVLLAGCDPAATEHVQAPQGGSLFDGARSSEGGSSSSERASASGDSTRTGGQVLPHAEPARAT